METLEQQYLKVARENFRLRQLLAECKDILQDSYEVNDHPASGDEPSDHMIMKIEEILT